MKYRLALVSYLNTLPFSEGLKIKQLESKFDIQRVTPAQCASLFKQGKVDISLCPVGALSEMPAHAIRGQYCIGADGEVGTVVLLSKVPLDKINSVRFDDHSRTSNMLLQVLADRYWKREWNYYMGHEEALPESCLMIGDKVFANKKYYPYHYDLGAAWKALTHLPMVFAVWITRPDVPVAWMDELDEAFRAGLEYVKSPESGLADWQLDYLLHHISYPFDDSKREAMQLYMEWAALIEDVSVTL